MSHIRASLALLSFYLGIMQGRVTYRRLHGLSMTGRSWWVGYLLSVLLVVAGLALALAMRGTLWIVALWALPMVPAAMLVLIGISSWANRHMYPPDAHCPGSDEPWTCEAVTFADGQVQTPALFLKPARTNGEAVCWVHGTGDGKTHYKWVLLRAFAQRGIAMLTFDLPGHGDHPGVFSLPEALTAVPAALAYLRRRPDIDPERIGLLGVSLGGALAVRTLADGRGEKWHPRAMCLLETPCSLFLDRWLYVREALGVASLQLLEVFRDCTVVNLWRRYSARAHLAVPIEWIIDDLAPAHHIAHIPSLPMLIVNGSRDPVAPPAHGRRLFERAACPKTWKVIRGGSHLSLIFMSKTAELVGDWFATQLNSAER